MTVCHDCIKKRSVPVCGSCRDINKYKMSEVLRSTAKVYLDEDNRNDEGMDSLLDDEEKLDLTYKRLMFDTPFSRLGREFGVSKTTASRVFHSTKHKYITLEEIEANERLLYPF